MPSERDHHLSKKNSFEIVVIPLGDTGSPKSFKASVSTIVLACVGIFILIASATVAAIIYTPAGLFLPMSEQQLQQRYGLELFEVQKRLNTLASEVLILREYNNKLRYALGQKVLPQDSTFDLLNIQNLPTGKDIAENDRADDNIAAQMTVSPNAAPLKAYRSISLGDEGKYFRAEFPIISPATGYISRRYESEQGHNGIDYAGKIGSLIVAAAEGYVVFSGYTADDGNTIILSHGDGFLTIYKHNQSILKSVGELVKRGEPMALLGNSGRSSSGPHLHFEVWKNGKAQNPNHYLIASEL